MENGRWQSNRVSPFAICHSESVLSKSAMIAVKTRVLFSDSAEIERE
jgi:hypothetical protein